jgi:hypothetical protein
MSEVNNPRSKKSASLPEEFGLEFAYFILIVDAWTPFSSAGR